jgi:hypothetical protein
MGYVVEDRGALAVVFWTEASFQAFYVLGEPEDGLAETKVQREEHLKVLIRAQFPHAPAEHRALDLLGFCRRVAHQVLKFVSQAHARRRRG